MSPVTKVCLVCATPFSRPPSRAGEYCSTACLAVTRQKRVNVICLGCGKAFEVQARRVACGEGKYCSQACYWKAPETVARVCVHCHATFAAAAGEVRRGRASFCTHKCAMLARRGAAHRDWKGGRKLVRDGRGPVYVAILQHGHPRATKSGYVKEHIVIAEQALGKPLPPLAVIHHVNEDGTDNKNANLVICQDQAYHLGLHHRLRLLRSGRAPFPESVAV